MSKDTHKLMLEHSQAKVQLYGSYLSKYLRVISQDKVTTDIHLYDLSEMAKNTPQLCCGWDEFDHVYSFLIYPKSR